MVTFETMLRDNEPGYKENTAFLAFDFCRFCLVIRFFHQSRLNSGPPALEASTIPLGYRGDGKIILLNHRVLFLMFSHLHGKHLR